MRAVALPRAEPIRATHQPPSGRSAALLPEPAVGAASANEVLVPAAFGDRPVAQDEDLVGGEHGLQNVHQMDPTARVVYVDKDPIVLAHGRALLEDNRTTTVTQADAAYPDAILDVPETRALIDLDEPWVVLMASVLHHLTDAEDPGGVTRRLVERMPSGSYLFTVDLLREDHPQAGAEMQADVVSRVGSGYMRTWDQIRRYYEGLEWVEPGLVYANDWRRTEPTEPTEPTDPAARTQSGGRWSALLVAGMGRKP